MRRGGVARVAVTKGAVGLVILVWSGGKVVDYGKCVVFALTWINGSIDVERWLCLCWVHGVRFNDVARMDDVEDP